MENRPGHRALRRGRASLPQHVYHLSAVTRSRVPFFADFHAACAACPCFENRMLLRDARMLAWVLMPDHAHWLLALGDEATLGRTIAALKSASARTANKVLGHQGALWSRAYYDRTLRQEEDLASAARYIIANPVRAGLVRRVGDYPFWNAVWLA